MVRLIVAALLLLIPILGRAEVVDRSAAGFTVRSVATIAAPPERSFQALVGEVGTWWEAEHTFSGSAANLSIAATPGGCFCERLANGGVVAHALVNHVVPGRLLRMTGALGPLQEHAVTGTLTWEFAAGGQGTTATLTYRVGGYFPGGLENLAGPVDQVLSAQLQRLKTHVERGAAAQTQAPPR